MIIFTYGNNYKMYGGEKSAVSVRDFQKLEKEYKALNFFITFNVWLV